MVFISPAQVISFDSGAFKHAPTIPSTIAINASAAILAMAVSWDVSCMIAATTHVKW